MIIFLFIIVTAIVYIIYGINVIKDKMQAHFELLEGISDDINEIRMKLRLGIVNGYGSL